MSLDARSKRLAIQAPLGFSSGLPLMLTGSVLTTWLASEDVDVKTIGAFALVSLPYNFKFLWAPLLDRFRLPLLGRRRGWMLLFQLLLSVALFAMGTIDAANAPFAVAVMAVCVATFSASQDIVVDAYRTDILREDERGQGTALYVIGYRIALIVVGSGGLIIADYTSWQVTYWIMACLMSVGVVASFLAPSPPAIEPPKTLLKAIYEPLHEFFTRKGALWLIGAVMLYKFGDSIAGHMVNPFLIATGFTPAEIGLKTGVGIAATIIGVGLGGIAADRIGIVRALLIFGALQALANVGYMALAVTGKSYVLLFSAICVDNVCNGLGTAALVAFLMTLCHRRFSATQYALFTSASSVLGRFLGATAGHVIGALGWLGFFATTIAAAVPALIMLYFVAPWVIQPKPETDAEKDTDTDTDT